MRSVCTQVRRLATQFDTAPPVRMPRGGCNDLLFVGGNQKRVAKGKTIVYLTDDETGFLNVDVDVFAKYPLERLAAALGDGVSVQNIGPVGRGLFQLHFALYGRKNADSAICGLAKVIRSLPRSARRLWNDASSRVFDLGFQGGFKPHSREFDISEEAVAAIVALGGAMKITIYVAPEMEALGTKAATTKNTKRSLPGNRPKKVPRLHRKRERYS